MNVGAEATWARRIEAILGACGPPQETRDDAGWILRWSPLGMFRNSSVWPRSTVPVPARGSGKRPDGTHLAGVGPPPALADRLARARRFYRDRGQAPPLVASPASRPPGLPAALGAEGWEVRTRCSVLVAPLARGRGVARSVMSALTSAAREAGAHTLWLQVEDANSPALSLYASLCFGSVYRYTCWELPGEA